MNEMSSSDIDKMVQFAEQLIFDQTKIYCSELQQNLLVSVLQGERKNYEQIADECGYSVTYIRQDIAPKLWQTFSQALDQRVTKANVRTILEKELRRQEATVSQSPPPQNPPPNPTVTQAFVPNSSSSWPLTMNPPMSPSFQFDDADRLESAIDGEDSTIPIESLPSNILLVDDQPQNLRLLADLLEEQGYEVQEAINGPIALQAVSRTLPDLILLDIHMPEMDGYTVCQQLKANPVTQDIPVIFVSAVDEVWDKVKAFSVGGVDYITKPFKVVEVLARVKNQLMVQQLQKSLKTQNTQLQALQEELKAQNAQLQQAIHELQRLAVIDHITQVASRYRFDQYLQSEWQTAMQDETALSLMLCHLDNFEIYNQRYGYKAGDHCLHQVAQTIKRVTQRPEDLVCRYGGEIFAIVLPALEENACETVARTILAHVSSLRIYQSDSSVDNASTANPLKYSSLTTSIGLASLVPTPGLGLEGLVEQCDRALQKAKIQGGNTIVRASTL